MVSRTWMDVAFALDKVEILESINGSFIVKQKKDELNSESSEINSENLDALENTDDENIESQSQEINTSEFHKINLNSISKYKLNDLQNLASKFNINVLKERNGEEINKTKKELYNELSLYKEN